MQFSQVSPNCSIQRRLVGVEFGAKKNGVAELRVGVQERLSVSSGRIWHGGGTLQHERASPREITAPTPLSRLVRMRISDLASSLARTL